MVPFKKRIEADFDDLKDYIGRNQSLSDHWRDWVMTLVEDIIEDVTNRRVAYVPEQSQALINFLLYIRECY